MSGKTQSDLNLLLTRTYLELWNILANFSKEVLHLSNLILIPTIVLLVTWSWQIITTISQSNIVFFKCGWILPCRLNLLLWMENLIIWLYLRCSLVSFHLVSRGSSLLLLNLPYLGRHVSLLKLLLLLALYGTFLRLRWRSFHCVNRSSLLLLLSIRWYELLSSRILISTCRHWTLLLIAFVRVLAWVRVLILSAAFMASKVTPLGSWSLERLVALELGLVTTCLRHLRALLIRDHLDWDELLLDVLRLWLERDKFRLTSHTLLKMLVMLFGLSWFEHDRWLVLCLLLHSLLLHLLIHLL